MNSESLYHCTEQLTAKIWLKYVSVVIDLSVAVNNTGCTSDGERTCAEAY